MYSAVFTNSVLPCSEATCLSYYLFGIYIPQICICRTVMHPLLFAQTKPTKIEVFTLRSVDIVFSSTVKALISGSDTFHMYQRFVIRVHSKST